MQIIVMGAGVVGVASAWFLQAAGHEVTVIDRQAAVGLETSFANGGQISVSHAEPWASPLAPAKILHSFGVEDAPLLFRPKLDYYQWRWGLQFLYECLPSRFYQNLKHLVRLGLYSRTTLQELRAETGIHYQELTRGILHMFSSAKDFEAAPKSIAIMRALGCEREVLSTEQCLAVEPALAPFAKHIAGVTYTASDETGDALLFTQALAQKAAEAGVRFRFNTTIERIHTLQGKVSHIEVKTAGKYDQLQADKYLVCLGCYSALLLRPVGVNLALYPVKGYSATIPVTEPDKAPYVSLIDEAKKMVYSRLGNTLRVAGTAEVNGYDTGLNKARCRMLVARAQELFPDACDYEAASFWAGLRPTTPGNIPYIGRSRLANLYLNTGHGTLGFTESCGSGRAIADLMSDKQPAVTFPFLR